ncbi:hypothetical protein BDN70DRAFT_921249 [Pholiota conissans]|uniref:Uncharacterized protein n=1 Tax=Pholiota conissans TaxID=109636 RepID=A0A9P5Z3I0_9AGAR|nr:hypothetical protein BDN70DRAFT_921249 [Pholiota conissans]
MYHNRFLPLEIIDRVMEDLASDDLKFVKSCALTSTGHLKIAIRISDEPGSKMKKLIAQLRRTPAIAEYTRHLHVHVVESAWQWNSPLVVPKAFKVFSKLESYELSYQDSRSSMPFTEAYTLNSGTMQPTLKELLLRPMLTLMTLNMDAPVTNFPFAQLPLYFPNLRSLKFGRDFAVLNQDEIGFLSEALPFEPAKLGHLRLQESNGKPRGDLLLSFWRQININIKFFCSSSSATHRSFITEEEIVLDLTGIGNLLLASSDSFKSIRISTFANIYHDKDPLHGLYKELEVLGRNSNVLETLSYELRIERSSTCSTGKEWAALDRVFEDFAWSKLKEASIDIYAGVAPLRYGDSLQRRRIRT